MKARFAEFEQLGCAVLAISFAPPNRVAEVAAEFQLPFPVVSDMDKSAYRAFGLERTSWGSILRPGVILRYVRHIGRGWLPRMPREGDDVMQLGGDFVLDSNRRLVYAHRSAEPTDNPEVDELLRAVPRSQ